MMMTTTTGMRCCRRKICLCYFLSSPLTSLFTQLYTSTNIQNCFELGYRTARVVFELMRCCTRLRTLSTLNSDVDCFALSHFQCSAFASCVCTSKSKNFESSTKYPRLSSYGTERYRREDNEAWKLFDSSDEASCTVDSRLKKEYLKAVLF
jgi:hypothetical protein